MSKFFNDLLKILMPILTIAIMLLINSIKDLNSEISELNKTVAVLNNSDKLHDASITSLNGNMDTYRDSINDLKLEIQKTIGDINTRVTVQEQVYNKWKRDILSRIEAIKH